VPGISSAFYKEVVFLSEIGTQCTIALLARDRMRTGVLAFNDDRNEHDKVLTGSPPAEILRSAHSFLTHAGIIYRLLYSPSHAAGKQFAEHLRGLLGIQAAPQLASAYNLRHSFEHVDERLHSFIANHDAGGGPSSYEGIRVLQTAPKPGNNFIRWVAPQPLQITFNAVSMNVDDIAVEIEDVKSRVSPAFARLGRGPSAPSPPPP